MGSEPSIKTERLLLRPATMDDAQALFSVYSDPLVMREIVEGPRDWQGTLRRLHHIVKHQERYGFSRWAVVERRTGTVIGHAGIQCWPELPHPELAYTLGRQWWGKGYATEAARAWLDYSFGELGLARVMLLVTPTNLASIRVAEKIGMHRVKETHHDGHRFLMFEIASSEGGIEVLSRTSQQQQPVNEPPELPRVVGTVDWWSTEEGWGCLTAHEAPGGVFVHFSEIVGSGDKNLRPGERVEFDLEDYPHGQDGYFFRAYRVKPLDR
jgi:[ribosomal protein S5]-alanine N-acetyltransferase